MSDANVERWSYLIEPAAALYQVPASWIKAVIAVESSGNPDAWNPEGSRGLMQIYEPTARGYGVIDLERLFDPAYNIGIGTRLLADLRGRFGDDFERVISAYNSGSPDLWERSSQVARHVQRALEALGRFGGSLTAAAPEGSAMALLALVAVVLIARRKR